MDLKSRLTSMADRGMASARGTSFVAKAKATKVVWFPPKPAETGNKAAAAASKATKKTAKKTTKSAVRATKKTAGAGQASRPSVRR